MSSSAAFVHRLRVRYHECDQQNVVFNANYFAYFDITLTEMWRAAMPGGYQEMLDGLKVDLVVAEATARFKAPARFDEEIDIAMTVAHMGTTSLRLEIEIRRDGQLLVEGALRHVVVDVGTHRKTPIPDTIRQALSRFAPDDDEGGASEQRPRAERTVRP